MRKLTKIATSISAIVALVVAGAPTASAQEEAGNGAVAHPTGAQVHWEKRIPGAYSWDQSRTLWNELNQSVRQFFGNATGHYIDRPSPKILNSREFKGYSLPSAEKWALISTQFQDPFLVGTSRRGTILNGRWELYEFDESGRMKTAFVTPVHSTKIVAAVMVHRTCPHTPIAPLSDDPKAAQKAILRNLACSKPRVTIFFKRPFNINRAIVQVLAREASANIIKGCQAEPIQQTNTDLHKRWVAKFGEPPPCRVHYKVVTLNEVPTARRTPPPRRQ